MKKAMNRHFDIDHHFDCDVHHTNMMMMVNNNDNFPLRHRMHQTTNSSNSSSSHQMCHNNHHQSNMDPRIPNLIYSSKRTMVRSSSCSSSSFFVNYKNHLRKWPLFLLIVLRSLLSTYLAIFSMVEAVHINSISRPQWYRYGTVNDVILDCDFSIDEQSDELLVVKWFLNDDPQHIYQWIQSRDVRIYSDKIKPFVDEKFFVKDFQTRHRAIRLLNPPVSLSGKYTCSVSSLQNEDINSTYLVIYEPAKSFEMVAIKDVNNDEDDDAFNITCTAIGLYPEPEIKLYKVKSINETLESEEVKKETTVLSFNSMTTGFYSITLTSRIDHNQSISDQDHHSPARTRLHLTNKIKHTTKTNIAEHYECRLSIPNSDYVEVKRLAIQDGWSTKWRSNGAASKAKGTLSLILPIIAVLAFLPFVFVG